MGFTIFKMGFSEDAPEESWADKEIKKQRQYLEEQRMLAIKYLGDKWILKGGGYSRSNKSLGEK